jgi:hypothetical protein
VCLKLDQRIDFLYNAGPRVIYDSGRFWEIIYQSLLSATRLDIPGLGKSADRVYSMLPKIKFYFKLYERFKILSLILFVPSSIVGVSSVKGLPITTRVFARDGFK